MWDQVLTVLHQTQNWLLVGAAILLGYAGGKLARLLRMPSVIGYLMVGVVLGGSLTNIIDHDTRETFGLVTDFGLAIVAFIIGSELSRRVLRRMGKVLTAILFIQFLGAVLIVGVSVWLLRGWILPEGLSAPVVALIFGALAAATAPAGTVAVIQEYRAKGPLTRMLLAVVGLDDGLAIMAYAFAVAIARMFLGDSLSFGSIVAGPVLEIVGALVVGGIAGTLLVAAVSRTRSRGEVLTLTIGTIILTTGLANVLHLSLILANLAVGAAVANLSKRETERTYSAIEQISQPIYILFFVVAGAHLDFSVLLMTGFLVPVYIVARSIGKMGGAYLGGLVSGSEKTMRRYLGFGLLSQAGVAVGLALMVSRDFAAYGDAGRQLGIMAINAIAASTIFFEIVGPIATRFALSRAGEVNADKTTGEEQ